MADIVGHAPPGFVAPAPAAAAESPPMPLLPPRDPRADLGRRLARLARVFDTDRIAAERPGAAEIVDYYEHCFDAYRRHHSAEGALHMALNEDGRFDPRGFAGQVERLAAVWAREPAPPRDVLELAFGHGYNLAALAARFPAVRFTGLDLTPRHVEYVRALLASREIGNAQPLQGDLHALPQADASFDAVFCVEAFCYAHDAPRALAEVARVLRPGGTLTLFDGYTPRPLSDMAEDEALAVALVAKGMALDRFQVLPEFLAQARAAGLVLESDTGLEAQIGPSLARLERLTGAVVRWPWLGRRALARRHPMRGRNVLAGYLMPTAVRLGLLLYRQLVFRRVDNPR